MHNLKKTHNLVQILMVVFLASVIANVAISSFWKSSIGLAVMLPACVAAVTAITISMRQMKKVSAFWKRCESRIRELHDVAQEKRNSGDYEGAEQFLRRSARVMDLWKKSLDAEEIPDHPQLEDL